MNKVRKDPDLARWNEVVYKTILRMMRWYYITLYNEFIMKQNAGRLWKWWEINGEERQQYIHLLCQEIF